MKDFIRIVESHWMDDKKKMMIHKDERGRLLVGKSIKEPQGSTIAVELSAGPIDGHYHIVKVIGIADKK